jgi:hypothetical protein
MKNKKIPPQKEFQNLLKNHRDRDKISNKEIHFVDFVSVSMVFQ